MVRMALVGMAMMGMAIVAPELCCSLAVRNSCFNPLSARSHRLFVPAVAVRADC